MIVNCISVERAKDAIPLSKTIKEWINKFENVGGVLDKKYELKVTTLKNSASFLSAANIS